jgi:trans-2,3-dihydro-3-hydroxyanthranilate isomerase
LVVFCAETYEPRNQLNVRVFADCQGIPEDPATGSGNGCLAAYLARNRYFGGTSVDIRVEQSYEIGRPSLLFLRSELGQGTIDVHVGGRVILVAEGHLL